MVMTLIPVMETWSRSIDSITDRRVVLQPVRLDRQGQPDAELAVGGAGRLLQGWRPPPRAAARPAKLSSAAPSMSRSIVVSL